jgi:aubergine-like protein
MAFIGVNKKISMRFYNTVGKSQGAKFIPNLTNPDSGSVVIEDLSVGNLMDFHLAAQKVTQGTCTPTQYIIIYQNHEMSIEALAEFTYGQCYNYPNWSGAVRVPACLQCADKLSKLVGESIKESLNDIGDL